jgi:hypothetical protein
VVTKRLRLDTRGIIVLIVINLAFSFIYRSEIAWQDHVGGLVIGALTTAAFAYAPRKNRAAIQVAAVVVIFAALAIAVIAKNHMLASQVSADGF